MRIVSCVAGSLVLAASLAPASAWDMSGQKKLLAHTSDGKDLEMGSVTFTPEGDRTKFAVEIDQGKMKEFFLSMSKFRCLDGKEIFCFVPYPYPNPKSVTANDLVWLEHSLLFFWKLPNDYGAKLGNGLYYKLKMTDKGLVGTPQAVNLDKIASPPDDKSKPPYADDSERDEVQPGERWVESIRIE